MRFGIWTPLPHTVRPEPRMERAIAALKGAGPDQGGDASFEFAVDVLRRGERYGFDVSLIATRELGPTSRPGPRRLRSRATPPRWS
jgi:FMNH2-dependent dimethyl sulfone monooxygenase